MNPRSILWTAGGLLLLGLAGWMTLLPRPSVRPDLPPLPPFHAGERVAVVMPDPNPFPCPCTLGAVQRAKTAETDVRFFATGESLADYAPDRILVPFTGDCTPAGYHPDRWPEPVPDGDNWLLLELTPEEQAVRNRALIQAAHDIRDSRTDDAAGTREAALLSHARRGEFWRQAE